MRISRAKCVRLGMSPYTSLQVLSLRECIAMIPHSRSVLFHDDSSNHAIVTNIVIKLQALAASKRADYI